jgi:glycosyltransferase involved in cell wall biosynthesis
MNSKRILFIGHEATRTGAPLVLLNVIKKLKLANYRCDILLLNGGKLEQEYRSLADKTISANIDSFIIRGLAKVFNQYPEKIAAFKLFYKTKFKKYDLIYANSVTTLIMAVELKKRYQIRILLHVHELEYAINYFVGNIQFNELSGSIDHFVAVSEAVKDILVNRYGIDPEIIDVIYPYPDQPGELFVHETKDKLGISKDTFVIGGAGQMSWTKGVDIFMLIAKEFARQTKNKDYKFIWVGGFPKTKHESEQFFLEKNKLEPANILFTGEVNNSYDYFTCFSVFLLTSKEESFSLVAVENALLKKPVICFEKCGGVNEWVKDGAGIEVPFGDINHAVDTLLKLSESPEMRRELGEKAFEIVTKRFSEESFAGKLMETTKSVIDINNQIKK